MKKFILAISIVSLSLASCSRDINSDTYVSSDTAGIVLKGVVVSARPVTVKAADKLQDNALGGLTGAAVGGVAGSTVGKGSGKTAATVGGVIAGAVLGAVIQDQLSTSDGIEYIVEVAKENQSKGNKTSDKNYRWNQSGVKDKIVGGTQMNTKTELISVVQGTDVVFQPGQPVYIIYTDSRPRLVAVQ